MKIILILLIVVKASAFAIASEVIQVGKDRSAGLVGISNDELNPWAKGQHVCVFRKETILTCGTVVNITPKFSVVRLEDSKVSINKGDRVEESEVTRNKSSEDEDLEKLAKEEKKPEPAIDEFRKGFLGPIIGLSFPLTGLNRSAIFTFGLEGGYSIYKSAVEDFNIGTFFITGSQSTTITGITQVDTISIVGLSLIGRRLFNSPFYAGGRFGVAFMSAVVPSLTGTATSFVTSPVVGIEFPVSKTITIGGDFSWLVIWASTMQLSNGSTFPMTSSSFINFLFNVRYNF